MKKVCILTLLLIVIFSCKHNIGLVDNNYGIKQSFINQEIEIIIDDNTLNSYPLHSNFVHQEEDYLICYNDQTNTFDVFNISSKTLSHIALMPEGQNAIFRPIGFYPLGFLTIPCISIVLYS